MIPNTTDTERIVTMMSGTFFSWDWDANIASYSCRACGGPFHLFAGHAAGFGVRCEDVGDGGHLNLWHPVQHTLDHFRDTREGEPPLEECFDGDFVRGVEGAGIRAFLAQRFAGQPQTREPPRGDLFEIEPAELGPIQGHFIGCSPLRVG